MIVKPRQLGSHGPLGAVAPRKMKILRLVFETEDRSKFIIKMIQSHIVTPVYCTVRARVETPQNGCLALINTSISGDKPSAGNTKTLSIFINRPQETLHYLVFL